MAVTFPARRLLMPDENKQTGLVDNHQFAASVYTKYQEHFDHYYKLLKFAEASLHKYRGLRKDSYHAVLQYICPRAFKSFDAIRRLCEIAYCEDAAVILRCLLNLMAVTRWISKDPEKRSKKYLGWYWIELQERAERQPDKFSAAATTEIQKHFDAEKSQFEYTNRKGKPDFAKQWYQPEVYLISDLFKEVGLEKHYQEAYKTLSGTEHSDVMAYYAMFATAEKKDGETKLEIQSDLFVRNYLRNGFQYFADIFGMCNKTMAYADDRELREIVEAGMSFYKADMKSESASTVKPR
jgi:hypothetical protein